MLLLMSSPAPPAPPPLPSPPASAGQITVTMVMTDAQGNSSVVGTIVLPLSAIPKSITQ
jgi:hypothetical protein